jgi:nitrite reductase (NADH) small subunit
MNYEGKWIRVTECDNIPLREGRAVRFGELEIAVFNLGSRFLAVENRCPHLGGPLSDGIVSGESVVCPLHAWKIGLHDGTVERPADVPKCIATFATRVEDGTVLLQLPDDGTAATPMPEQIGAYCLERQQADPEELSA